MSHGENEQTLGKGCVHRTQKDTTCGWPVEIHLIHILSVTAVVDEPTYITERKLNERCSRECLKIS